MILPRHLFWTDLSHYSSLHFYKLVVLSAWVWQQLDVPCFCPMPFLLHSHSMTSVKRTSSFHENSHSTRARSRVSRKQVIQNVSNLLETMSHAAQKMGDTHDTSIPHIQANTCRRQAGEVLLLWPMCDCNLDPAGPSFLGKIIFRRMKQWPEHLEEYFFTFLKICGSWKSLWHLWKPKPGSD